MKLLFFTILATLTLTCVLTAPSPSSLSRRDVVKNLVKQRLLAAHPKTKGVVVIPQNLIDDLVAAVEGAYDEIKVALNEAKTNFLALLAAESQQLAEEAERIFDATLTSAETILLEAAAEAALVAIFGSFEDVALVVDAALADLEALVNSAKAELEAVAAQAGDDVLTGGQGILVYFGLRVIVAIQPVLDIIGPYLPPPKIVF